MSDEEDTIIVPQGRKKPVVLLPVGPWFEKVELNLSTPARLGRVNSTPNYPNFVPLSSKVVSRNHAEIWESDRRIYIRDSGSASGTFINKQRLSANGVVSGVFELHHGDHLQLGVNYTDDEISLAQDGSLRCVIFEVLLPSHPPIIPQNPSFSSSLTNQIGTPVQLGDVDLNNLTNVIKVAKSRTASDFNASPASYGSPAVVPSSYGKSPDDNYFNMRKQSNPDIQNALLKKKELEDKINSAYQKAGNVATQEIKKEKNHFVVAIVRQAFKLSKVQVQSNSKDVFTVNIKPWETSNKLLIQDHRCQFTKTPSFEIIKDPFNKPGDRFNVVHLNGTLIASIDKTDNHSVKITPVSGGYYNINGDISSSYIMSFNAVKIAEIEEVETSRNAQKGNLSRILNVFVDADHNHQLVLAAVVVLTASFS